MTQNGDPPAVPAIEAAAKPALAWVGEPIGYAREAPPKTAGVRFLAGVAAVLLLGLAAGRNFLLVDSSKYNADVSMVANIKVFGPFLFVLPAVVAAILLFANAVAARRPSRLFFVALAVAIFTTMVLGDLVVPPSMESYETNSGYHYYKRTSKWARIVVATEQGSTPTLAYPFIGIFVLPLAAFAGFALRELEAGSARRIMALVAAVCLAGVVTAEGPANYVLEHGGLLDNPLNPARLAPFLGPVVAAVGFIFVLAGVRGSLIVFALAAAAYLADAVYVPVAQFNKSNATAGISPAADEYIDLARVVSVRVLAIPMAIWLISLGMLSQSVRSALRSQPRQ